MLTSTEQIIREMNDNFGSYNNMPSREMYIRISDMINLDISQQHIKIMFSTVKETREYILSKLDVN